MRYVSYIAKHGSNVPGIELLYHILFTQNEYSAMEKIPYAVMSTAQYIMKSGIKIKFSLKRTRAVIYCLFY